MSRTAGDLDDERRLLYTSAFQTHAGFFSFLLLVDYFKCCASTDVFLGSVRIAQL